MSFPLRVSFCLLTLSLGVFCPASAQSQSVPNSSTSSEVNDLAATLVAAASEEEQERLLARKPGLTNSSLLAALKALADPFVQKGDYAEALRITVSLRQLGLTLQSISQSQLPKGHYLSPFGILFESK